MKAGMIILFLLIPLIGVNGDIDTLSVPDKLRRLTTDNLESTLSYLESKRHKFKNPQKYIEWVYYKVHHKKLKRYKQYSSLKETIESGNYDCVTGTALYAGIYKALGFDVYIKESTYHVYLIVKTERGDILIESTDPLNGVVSDPEEISGWENSVRIGYAQSQSIDKTYNFKKISNRSISSNELLGLLYFNQAVRYYNAGLLTNSMGYIEAGLKCYPSDRMYTMAALIAKGMRDSESVDPIISKIYCEKYLPNSLKVAGY